MVKKAISGDTVVLLGPVGKNGLPKELILKLYGVEAPRMDKMEPFCRDSRDFLRRLLAGKLVQMHIFNGPRNIMQGHLYIDGKNVSLEVLKNGWANIDEHPIDERTPPEFDQFQAAYDSAFSKNLGIFSGSPYKYGNKAQLSTNLEDLFKQTKEKELTGYVEDIEFNFNFKICIPEHDSFVQIMLKGITIPIINADHAK